MVLYAKSVRFVQKSTLYILLTVLSLVMMYPLLWTLSTSFKIGTDVTLQSLTFPDPIAWWNYVDIFQRMPMISYLVNTLTIVLAGLLGSLVTCSLAGYAFAQIPFPGRNVLFTLVLSTMMLPYVVRLIPLYVMFDQLRLVNTLGPLIIPRLLGHDAFFIFLLRQFFKGIPVDLFDAARVDGCMELGIWRQIVLPLSLPVLATVSIFSFQHNWNDFLNPLIYLGGNRNNWTLTLGLQSMKSFAGDVNYNLMMAFSTLMIIPMLVVFGLGQRFIVQGTVTSGIKG